jgi:hypothetical protein
MSESHPGCHVWDRGWDCALCEVRAEAEETVCITETACNVWGSVRGEADNS